MDWQGTERSRPILQNPTLAHEHFVATPKNFVATPKNFGVALIFFTIPRRTECAKAPQEPLVQSFHTGQPARHYSISAQPSGRPVADADEKAVRDFVELGLQAGRVSDGFTNVSDILRRMSQP